METETGMLYTPEGPSIPLVVRVRNIVNIPCSTINSKKIEIDGVVTLVITHISTQVSGNDKKSGKYLPPKRCVPQTEITVSIQKNGQTFTLPQEVVDSFRIQPGDIIFVRYVNRLPDFNPRLPHGN